jgi:hypothetical protein
MGLKENRGTESDGVGEEGSDGEIATIASYAGDMGVHATVFGQLTSSELPGSRANSSSDGTANVDTTEGGAFL